MERIKRDCRSSAVALAKRLMIVSGYVLRESAGRYQFVNPSR